MKEFCSQEAQQKGALYIKALLGAGVWGWLMRTSNGLGHCSVTGLVLQGDGNPAMMVDVSLLVSP